MISQTAGSRLVAWRLRPLPQQQSIVQEIVEEVIQEEAPRKDRLMAAARTLLEELSGHDLSGVDPGIGLLELGLDSLLLTQAASLFQRKFGVSLSFRQLMEDLSSVDAIATYLDESYRPTPSPRLPKVRPAGLRSLPPLVCRPHRPRPSLLAALRLRCWSNCCCNSNN